MSSESPSASDVVAARAGTPPPQSPRLGLALSGGGFRATLFHLGVLTRLAELDLLRHLHMISSVSGGSVLAAHYMLLLKHELEQSDGRLPNATYVAIVQRLREELSATLERAPRNLLLANPLANLRMALLGASRFRLSMGERMAAAYQRFLFRSGTERVASGDPAAISHGLRLPDMTIRLPEVAKVDDIQRYNALADADCIPQLVLNSATLNTAARFTFTFAEVGDEVLGFVRFDERDLLLYYRRVLDSWKPSDDPERTAARAWSEAATRSPALPGAAPRGFVAEHLAWFHAARIEQAERGAELGRTEEEITRRRRDKPGGAPVFRDGPRSAAVRHLATNWEHSIRFLEAPFSVLRTAKVAAWYLLNDAAWRPRDPAALRGEADGAVRRGGFTRGEHRRRFWDAVRDVDQVMKDEIHTPQAAALAPTRDEVAWYEFVLELYYLRVAQNLEADHPEEIRLPTAVQASANFPPVFGALRLFGLFDRRRIEVLQLSDGGLNDNNGLEALLEGRCTHVIASEAGPRPGIKSPVRMNRLGLLQQIMVNQLPIVRRLLMRTLREQQRVHAALDSSPTTRGGGSNDEFQDLWRRYPVEAVAFFDMDSKLSDGVDEQEEPHPLAPHPLARDIALLRTDLDGFSPVEREALLYQGYQYADRFVRRYVHPKLALRLPLPAPPPAVAPALLPEGEDEWRHVRTVLRAGSSLFRRAWAIGGISRWLWLLATLLAATACLALAILVAWGRNELLARIPPQHVAVEGMLSVATWVLSVLLWLIPAMDVFGIWVWMDGRLAALAARTPRSK